MQLDGLRVETDANVAEIVLDRPPVNAVAVATYEALMEVVRTLSAQEDVQVILLRSANERLFCAGADIREVQAIVDSDSTELDERRQRAARQAYDVLLNAVQPTIAVVNGAALGAGAVLAACCDIRYAARGARIGLTEINVARCGGGRHLMRLMPQGRLREMYFTGEPLEADAALAAGLVDRVFEPGAELAAARDLAGRIAGKSPIALRHAKQALNACEPLPLDEGYAVEQSHTIELGRTEDAREAARAFLEKRDPVWRGR